VILIPRLGDHRISEGWLFGGPLTRLLPRYVSWTVIDFLVAFASIGLVGVLWRLGGPLDIGLGRSVQLAVLLAFFFGFVNTLLGLKNVEWSRAAAEDVLRLFVSCGLVTLAVVLAQTLILPGHGLPTRFLILAGLMVSVSFMAARYRLRLITGLASRWIDLRNSGYGAGERVLVVGAGEGSVFAAWLLRLADFRRLYTVVGIADDDPRKQGMRFDGLQVLGTTADIPDLVRQHDIGVIFYSIVKISPADQQRILATCRSTNLRLIMLPDVLQMLHGHLKKGRPYAGSGFPLFIDSEPYAEATLENLDS
jgi:FlaA1/EpsC-like NDP-sugar epimerase